MFGFMSDNINHIIKSKDDDKGNLYLGNYEAAKKIPNLKNLKINYVLTVLPKEISDYGYDNSITQKVIEANDCQTFKIYDKLNEGAEFILESLKNGNILVHCAAGISRCSTMVCAYLIKYENKKLEDALTFIRENRPIATPNTGFMKQLDNFYKEVNKDK